MAGLRRSAGAVAGVRGVGVFAVMAAAVSAAAPSLEGEPVAQEVTFAGEGGFELSGTLLIPEGEPEGGAWPAVLLLPGSGPTDRDGNQPPMLRTDLLKQMAEALAEAGVASLRFDKRAAGVYQGRWPETPEEMNAFFGWEEFVGDAAAAYRWVRDREEIADDRVVIAGHSEGGLIALQIASDMAGEEGKGGEHGPAGLVLMATAGRTLDGVLREQIAAALSRQGADEATTAQYAESLERAIAAVKAGEPLPGDLPAGLRPLFNPTVLDILRSYFTIDPAELAKAYKGPVLIVQGDRDAQVSAERDTPRLEGALKAREAGSVRTLIVPGASHNLKEAGGTGPLAGFTGPVKPEALEGVVGWLKERFVVSPGGAEEEAPGGAEASE